MEQWLEPRLRDVPSSLRERIVTAVREAGSGKREADGVGSTLPASRFPLPDTLRAAGERLLGTARSAPPSRDTALTLLAADGLMTFACEALAEEAPERLGELG